jgi:hypothetical protein
MRLDCGGLHRRYDSWEARCAFSNLLGRGRIAFALWSADAVGRLTGRLAGAGHSGLRAAAPLLGVQLPEPCSRRWQPHRAHRLKRRSSVQERNPKRALDRSEAWHGRALSPPIVEIQDDAEPIGHGWREALRARHRLDLASMMVVLRGEAVSTPVRRCCAAAERRCSWYVASTGPVGD